jgi:hypothetical protein
MIQQSQRAERQEGEPCDVEQARRPSIKIPPGPPHILIAVPIGGKADAKTFPVPKCDLEGCSCPNHGKSVTTTTRNQGLVPVEFAINMANIVTPLNTTVGYLIEKGKLSAEARNRMTQRAIELGAKYLFYWDDDVLLHPHMLYAAHNILETNDDIGLVTGVYFAREHPTEPFIYKEQGKGAWWNFSLDPAHPPQDIHGCGGGCIMVRVEDLKKMTPPYWADEQIVHDGGLSQWGHDIRFVKKFREETGKRTVVKGHLLCQHIDYETQEIFELPKDSPLARNVDRPQVMPWAVIQESPPLTPDFVDEQIVLSNGLRRMFVVLKADQSEEDMKQVLSQRFHKHPIYSMDDRWVAVCEEPIGLPSDPGGNGHG